MRQVKVIVEKHADGYVAYPLGLKGVVVGQGDTYEDVLADVGSAIRSHVATLGVDVLDAESPVLEAFVAEIAIRIQEEPRGAPAPAPIAILEDNEGRRAAMRGELDRGLPGSEASFFDNAPDMIRWLTDKVATLRLISLDHDLGPSRERDGEPSDPGTGRDVADWLTSVRPVCPVLIHTSNAVDAQGMRFALEDAGWRTRTVVPSRGDEWIRKSWLPRAAELLRLRSGGP